MGVCHFLFPASVWKFTSFLPFFDPSTYPSPILLCCGTLGFGESLPHLSIEEPSPLFFHVNRCLVLYPQSCKFLPPPLPFKKPSFPADMARQHSPLSPGSGSDRHFFYILRIPPGLRPIVDLFFFVRLVVSGILSAASPEKMSFFPVVRLFWTPSCAESWWPPFWKRLQFFFSAELLRRFIWFDDR